MRACCGNWSNNVIWLSLNDGLISQHDGQIVTDRVNSLAFLTLDAALVFFERELSFADRTDQNIEHLENIFAVCHAPLF